MDKILFGNLNKEKDGHPERRGWFMGQFLEHSSPLHSKDLEIKWGIHKAGEIHEKVRMNKNAKSQAILIDGQFKFTFPDTNQVYYLKNKGDFVFWDSSVYHSTESKKDSTILTIRWPSLPNDVRTK